MVSDSVMQRPWTLGWVASVCRARIAGVSSADWEALSRIEPSGASIDSRRVRGGEVFVALPGSRRDGHEFVGHALRAGAVGAIVEERFLAGERVWETGVLLVVDDCLGAMTRWAAAAREAASPRVLAVTGSSGKTTTKEIAAALLRHQGPTVATRGNRNNEIGLPLTLLELTPGTKFLVVEMGMNHAGEISRLSRTARPDVAVITCIGRAHEGFLGGREGVLEAKLEILDGMDPESGVLVLPDDDPILRERVRKRWGGEVRLFGLGSATDYRAEQVQVSEAGTHFVLAGRIEGRIRSRLLGEAGLKSILAAVAAVHSLSGSRPNLEAVSAIEPVPGRMDAVEHEGVLWIIDSYNASPESTIGNLRFVCEGFRERRKIFVFGGMRELGGASPERHREVGSAAGGCDVCIFVGEDARQSAAPAQRAGAPHVSWYPEIGGAASELKRILRPGDIVFLKGARAAAMERIAVELGVVPPSYVKAVEGHGADGP